MAAQMGIGIRHTPPGVAAKRHCSPRTAPEGFTASRQIEAEPDMPWFALKIRAFLLLSWARGSLPKAEAFYAAMRRTK